MSFLKSIIFTEGREVRPGAVYFTVVLLMGVFTLSILQTAILVFSAHDVSAPVWLGDLTLKIKDIVTDLVHGY